MLVSLSACTSVPLSTLWTMRHFSIDEFFAKQPRDLRVAIRTDHRVVRGPNNPSVDVRIDGGARPPICYAFPLVPIDAQGPAELTLDPPPADRRWYAFALSRQGVDAFERVRREIPARMGSDANFHLSVSMGGVLDLADGQDRAPMRIDVALDRRDGYFTLIKETTLERGTTRSSSRGSTKPASANDERPCPAMTAS